MFYSADELSGMLQDIGYRDVRSRTLLAGMIGFHRASKASQG
jgi:demethylmenaquinone methyltransferase/2-methoxy-6-polyprenyl-1,4-benzoquinol methylase